MSPDSRINYVSVWMILFVQTLFLIADQGLQSDGGFYLDGHLLVLD